MRHTILAAVAALTLGVLLGGCQGALGLIPDQVTETVAGEAGERVKDYCDNVGTDIPFRMKLLDLVNAGDSPDDPHVIAADCDGDWEPDFESNPALR